MKGRVARQCWTAAACWLIAIAIVWVNASPPAHALNFAVYPLKELAANADKAFIGTVVKKEDGAEDWYDRYTFRVDIPLHGSLAKDVKISARVTQFADEGVLSKGDPYLILLDDYGVDGYAISGVHQGFIKLKNGIAESRFYEQEEVDRYLELYGLKVKTIYERLLPAEKSPARKQNHGRDAEIGIAVAAGVALIAMLVGLYFRSRRMKNRAK